MKFIYFTLLTFHNNFQVVANSRILWNKFLINGFLIKIYLRVNTFKYVEKINISNIQAANVVKTYRVSSVEEKRKEEVQL